MTELQIRDRGFIKFVPVYADVFDDVSTAILCQYIYYRQLALPAGELVDAPQEVIFRETRLSPKVQRRAFGLMKEMGVLIEQRVSIPGQGTPKRYRIDVACMQALIDAVYAREDAYRTNVPLGNITNRNIPIGNLTSGNLPSGADQSAQRDYCPIYIQDIQDQPPLSAGVREGVEAANFGLGIGDFGSAAVPADALQNPKSKIQNTTSPFPHAQQLDDWCAANLGKRAPVGAAPWQWDAAEQVMRRLLALLTERQLPFDEFMARKYLRNLKRQTQLRNASFPLGELTTLLNYAIDDLTHETPPVSKARWQAASRTDGRTLPQAPADFAGVRCGIRGMEEGVG